MGSGQEARLEAGGREKHRQTRHPAAATIDSAVVYSTLMRVCDRNGAECRADKHATSRWQDGCKARDAKQQRAAGPAR
jgi:hypothetical protein